MEKKKILNCHLFFCMFTLRIKDTAKHFAVCLFMQKQKWISDMQYLNDNNQLTCLSYYSNFSYSKLLVKTKNNPICRIKIESSFPKSFP